MEDSVFEGNEQEELLEGEDELEIGCEIPEPVATTFEEILPEGALLDGIRRLGFATPTEVQARTVPGARGGSDMIVQAKTGSGKTLAFVLPLLERLSEVESDQQISSTFALVVVPTRELALQVVQVVNSLTEEVKPACLIGGVEMQQQLKELDRDRRVVVGTPGRILDCLRQKALRLNQTRFFVLDEVDEMLSIGFIDDVRTILSRLPDKRQGLFLSATVTPRVDMLAHSFLSTPKHVVLNTGGDEQPLIDHWFYEIGGDLMAKPSALCDLIETLRPASAIIFCNTKSDTQLVEVLLRRRGFDARRINSDLSQSQRNRVMKKIRSGSIQFLVATDIAARGIDIAQIDLVINYAIHEQPEIYVHRTGRTGRAGRQGRAISLVGPRDFSSFHFLTKVLDRHFEKKVLPTDTEVADARSAHLYELMRLQAIELKDRDLLVARRVLSEIGGIDTPNEELEQLLAKMCRYTIEHSLQAEARALEEELELAQDAEEAAKREESGERRESRRGRDRDRGGRGERGDRDRGRGERDRGERDRGERDRGGRGGRDRRGGEEERYGRDERPRRDHEDSPRNADSESRHSAPSGSENPREDSSWEGNRSEGENQWRDRRRNDSGDVRVYVGQGTSHGMTPEVFTSLAGEFADLQPAAIRSISLREHYGFVDLSERDASSLVGSMNGIEYNGQPLPIEIAQTPAPSEGGRRGGRGGRYGGERREGDRRGGGYGGGRRDRDDRRGGGRGDRRRDRDRY